MFKNIQDKLLISNPLLWNLKIVPFAAVALCFHIIFFALGYISGAIEFQDYPYQYYDSGFDTGVAIFFSVIVSILMAIVWLVLYSRNNAFKSFYPKTTYSLFKEFLYIGLFFVLACTFSLSYLYAKDARARNYYSQKEIEKKLEILRLASVFVEGAFEKDSYVYVQVGGQEKRQMRETFRYRDRTYSLSSLMNKRVETDYYYSSPVDSASSRKVRTWLYENRKDSVRWVLDEFMKMARQENLKSNISSQKWLDLVYDYPEFKNYTIIKRSKDPSYYSDYQAATMTIDSTAEVVEVPPPAAQASSSYYVPYRALQEGYSEISRAYENPAVDFDFLCFYLYLSLGAAVAVFSFKVTSGRNWLIAMVSLGVISLITGIFSALSAGTAFFVFYLLIFFGLIIYFFSITTSRKGKGISGIALNHILWMSLGIVPVIYYSILAISKSVSGYYSSSGTYVSGEFIRESYPKIEWLENHFPEMIIANIGLAIIIIFFFSIQIKKWKGIAED